MKKWFIKNKLANFNEISEKFGINEVTARLITNRGIDNLTDIKKYINASVDSMYNPHLMKDIDKAVDILENKIRTNKKIRIVGDYDVDGIISTYILIIALRKCEADVDFEIPDRIIDGYGINKSIIKNASDDKVDTILTCDNGISALEQTDYAKELGMTFIITDHHDIPFVDEDDIRMQVIPKADAVVNPHQTNCEYPYKNLCGAAVAYKLIEILYERFEIDKKQAHSLIEYVALATVCDVMELKDENRIFVKCGLDMINQTSNIGLKALIDVCSLDKIYTYHLGFILGPCLNATGRLASAKKAIYLLLSEDENEAKELAKELKELNDSRKQMTIDNLEIAIKQIENSDLINDKVLVIFIEQCHESLAGIIAGRLRDRYYRPTIVITNGEKGAKGSCRSIESYNMFEELSKCSEYLDKFGGHPMAAGLSLKKENIDKLRLALNQKTTLTKEDLVEKISIDVLLPLGYISEDMIGELDILEPFGKGNEKPLFAEKNLVINSAKVLGKNTKVLKMNVTNQYNKTMDAIYFGDIGQFENYIEEEFGKENLIKAYNGMSNDIKLSVIYSPSINEYNGRKSLQIQIKEYMATKN